MKKLGEEQRKCL